MWTIDLHSVQSRTICDESRVICYHLLGGSVVDMFLDLPILW